MMDESKRYCYDNSRPPAFRPLHSLPPSVQRSYSGRDTACHKPAGSHWQKSPGVIPHGIQPGDRQEISIQNPLSHVHLQTIISRR